MVGPEAARGTPRKAASFAVCRLLSRSAGRSAGMTQNGHLDFNNLIEAISSLNGLERERFWEWIENHPANPLREWLELVANWNRVCADMMLRELGDKRLRWTPD